MMFEPSSNLFLLSVNPNARIKCSDIESLSAAFPCITAWKRRDHIFSGISEKMIDYFKLPTREKILGYADRDIAPLDEFADYFVRNDELVMKHARPFIFYEDARNGDDKLIKLFVNKYPVYDDSEKNVIGIFLNATPLDNHKAKSFFSQECTLIMPNALTVICEKYYFTINSEVIILTEKESRVLYHYLRGCSPKEIGYRISLSSRTVEDYIGRIKHKLQLFTRSAIIECAINLGIFHYVPYSEIERRIK